MTNEEKQDVAAECRRLIAEARKEGAGYRTVAKGKVAEIAIAALTAQSHSWKLVPKNATGQMVSAWREAIHSGASIEGAFLRMVEAAPEPLERDG